MSRDNGGSELDTAQYGKPHEIYRAVRELRPFFQANAEKGDKLGALTPEVEAALRKHDLFSIYLPKCLGGPEIGPVQGLQIVEELSYADGPTGWIVMANALSVGTAGCFLGDNAVQTLFGNGARVNIAGQGMPNGKAIPTKGGYRVSGNWSYASGLKHAEYIHTGAVVHIDGVAQKTREGLPDMRIFVVPTPEATLGDNWDVLGLRATGSIDYSIDDVFVPEEFQHLAETRKPLRGGAFYTLGIVGFANLGHTGFALGVGRRVLDELAHLARTKRGLTGLLGASESFVEKFADAEARYRAAKALCYDTWRSIQDTLESGKEISRRQGTLYRLALNHVTSTVADIATFAYRAGGGVALRNGDLQRYFRDMHGGTQHVLVSPYILQNTGRELAGMASDKAWWALIGLIDQPA